LRIRARDSGQIVFVGREQGIDRPPYGEEQFRAVAESVADGIVSISGSGEVIYFNPAAQLTYGYRPAEVLGSPFISLVAERWQGAYEKAMRRFLARGRHELIGTTQEAEGKRRNGEVFPAEIVLSPWAADGETYFTAVVRDITERKTLVQLEQSNSDLEQFAYLASHDLGEPLRTIKSYVQLLDARYGGCLGQDAEDFIDFALQGTQRMQALIDSLLEYSRASSPVYELRSVDCNEVVHSVLALLRAKITDSGATVETRELPIVWADARQISRVFQNLITNALTYRREAPTVRIGAERVVGAWCFSVSDKGIGIAEADAGRIFGMLERLHTPQEYGGSGMGLAICTRIIERHGGRIWAEPNPEGGTRFCFTIPDPDSGSLDGRR
jgi:PAS domain S-box-containing protein